MLALRERFGEDNWLSSQAGTFIQDIMGLHAVSQSATLPATRIQTLADINVTSSLHESLIYMMDSEQSLDESESHEIAVQVEVEKEDIPQDEETLLVESPEAEETTPVTVYDPKEGDNRDKVINYQTMLSQ